MVGQKSTNSKDIIAFQLGAHGGPLVLKFHEKNKKMFQWNSWISLLFYLGLSSSVGRALDLRLDEFCFYQSFVSFKL